MLYYLEILLGYKIHELNPGPNGGKDVQAVKVELGILRAMNDGIRGYLSPFRRSYRNLFVKTREIIEEKLQGLRNKIIN